MDVTISAGFSGRPYDLRMRIYTIENNLGGNYSRYHGHRYGYSRSGWGSWANNAYTVDSWIAGNYAGGAYSLPFAPGDYAGKTIYFGEYDTAPVGHDGNGNLWFASRIRMITSSVFGSADTGDVGMWGDRLPQAPGAPGAIGWSDVTPTSVTLSWGGAPRGRADITNYHWQISSSPGFGSIAIEATGGVFYADNTGDNGTLTPGTTHYGRVQARNGDGWGPYSSVTSFSTLPATAPGMVVTPHVSGQSALVTLTPPGGASGVTKYTVERRIGTGPATSGETVTTNFSTAGLVPGTTYQWRASAWFGGYQSPWTAWTPVIQPNPNTNPGDYYDGSSAPRDDLTFAWSSTPHLSPSTANGVGALGWDAGVVAGGGTVAEQRVTGGRSGEFGSRMWVLTDATGAGKYHGMDKAAPLRAPVVGGGSYTGLIYVRPSRPQRERAEIVWLNSSDVEVGSHALGPQVAITETTAYTPLLASGVAPDDAVWAVVRSLDVAGDGHSPWLSGEWHDADDAMISLGATDWFSGDSETTSRYDYVWLDEPNASTSMRVELEPNAEDPLADPDCPPIPAPPAVPVIDSDCIVEVGTWRRYMVQVPADAVRAHTASLPTLILSTDTVAERQVRIRYFPNPEGLAPNLVDLSVWEAEQIITYIPPHAQFTLDGVTQLVWAEVNGGEPISADRMLYGTGGKPASWPELTCGYGYVITLDVPVDAPAGNLSTRLLITQRT